MPALVENHVASWFCMVICKSRSLEAVHLPCASTKYKVHIHVRHGKESARVSSDRQNWLHVLVTVTFAWSFSLNRSSPASTKEHRRRGEDGCAAASRCGGFKWWLFFYNFTNRRPQRGSRQHPTTPYGAAAPVPALRSIACIVRTDYGCL